MGVGKFFLLLVIGIVVMIFTYVRNGLRWIWWRLRPTGDKR